MRLFERLSLAVLLLFILSSLITCGAYKAVKVIIEVEKGLLNNKELEQ